MPKQNDWLLIKIDRGEDRDDYRDESKLWRGEVLYKGELMWIIDADTDEELERRAYEVKRKAEIMTSADEDDPDADMTTFMSL